VNGVAWSPDGTRLATAGDDRTVRIWDPDDGRELFTLRGHDDQALSVAWNRDGNRLVSGSRDQTVRIWDSATGQELLRLRGQKGPIRSVAFSSDGRRLASGSTDPEATLWVYALDSAELLHLARKRVSRDLTSEECLRYFQSKTCPPLPQ